MKTEPTEAPNPRITIDLGNDTTSEIFMSYGLLRELVKAVTGPDSKGDMMAIYMDVDIQNEVLTTLLSDRNEEGEIVSPFVAVNSRLSPDEVVRINDWVESHVLNFFVQSGEKMKATALKFGSQLSDLTSSEAGSNP